MGLALGLIPSETNDNTQPCDRFAEYELPDGPTSPAMGFCLEGVTVDPVEEKLLALQILGYLRNEESEDYARAAVAFDRDEGGRTPEERLQAARHLLELRQELERLDD